jgi:hypothetical protein
MLNKGLQAQEATQLVVDITNDGQPYSRGRQQHQCLAAA